MRRPIFVVFLVRLSSIFSYFCFLHLAHSDSGSSATTPPTPPAPDPLQLEALGDARWNDAESGRRHPWETVDPDRPGGRCFSESYCIFRSNAAAHYLQALNLRPRRAELWFRMSLVGGLHTGDLELEPSAAYGPEECVLKALDINPEFLPAWFALGKNGGGKISNVDYTVAQCFENVLKFDPRPPEIMEAWALLGNEGGGVNVLEQVRSSPPSKDSQPEQEHLAVLFAAEFFAEPLRIWRESGFQAPILKILSDLKLPESEGHQGPSLLPCAPSLDYKSKQLNPSRAEAWVGLGQAGGGIVREKPYTPAECFARALEEEALVNPRSWYDTSASTWLLLAGSGGGRVWEAFFDEESCRRWSARARQGPQVLVDQDDCGEGISRARQAQGSISGRFLSLQKTDDREDHPVEQDESPTLANIEEGQGQEPPCPSDCRWGRLPPAEDVVEGESPCPSESQPTNPAVIHCSHCDCSECESLRDWLMQDLLNYRS